MNGPLPSRPRVGLFVTCLVDLMRPSIGFAAVKLLEQAGCSVEVPSAQTCCGQPAYNSGDKADAAAIPDGLKTTLRILDDSAGAERGKFQEAIEQWFDEAMARVSGWYKRQAERIVLVLSLILFLNRPSGKTIRLQERE